VRAYLDALKQAGFQVFEGVYSTISMDNLQALAESLENDIKEVAREGFVVLFVSRFWFADKWLYAALQVAQLLGAKVIRVAIEPNLGDYGFDEIPFIDGTHEPTEAPNRLAVEMLRRRV